MRLSPRIFRIQAIGIKKLIVELEFGGLDNHCECAVGRAACPRRNVTIWSMYRFNEICRKSEASGGGKPPYGVFGE